MFAPCALGELAEDEVLGVFIGTGRIVGAGPATSERGSGLRDLKGGGQMKREALASALSVERARRLGQPGVRRRRTHLAESRRLTRDAASYSMIARSAR
jgi:hypothetical protein